MNFYHRNRGAVSIFLIIVLVPCIVISSIFTDLARVEMSKISAESAADLALNTLLTNYDADLKEYYGLIGSCQTIEQFYDVSAEYFLRTISSQGLSDDEILLLSDVYSSMTGDDTIHDLLQVEAQGDVTVKAVEGADLSNPAMLKDQIVEFMKYRAPIEIATTLFARLKNDSSIDMAIEADENSDLVKAKEEFYTAEGNMLSAAFKTYLALGNYRTEQQTDPYLNNEQLQNYASRINSMREAYRIIHRTAAENLLNTDKLTSAYQRVVLDITPYQQVDMTKMSDVYSSSKKSEDGATTTYYINNEDYNKHITAADNAIKAFTSAKSAYERAVGDLMTKVPGSNDTNPVQWCVQMYNTVYYSSNGNYHETLRRSGVGMLENLKTLLAQLECEEEPKEDNDDDYVALPETWRETCQDLIRQIEDCYNSYLSSNPDGNDAYIKAARKLAEVSKSVINQVKPEAWTIQINGQEYDYYGAIGAISSELSDIYERLDKTYKLLDIVINGDEASGVPSLSDLSDLANSYRTGLTNYETEAQESADKDSDMGEQELAEIEEKKNSDNGDGIYEEISAEAVSELKTRLENIQNQLRTLMDAIDGMKYGNISLRWILDFSDFRECALTKVKTDEIPLTNSAIQSKAEEWFGQLFVPNGTVVTLQHTSGNSHNPEMNTARGNTTDTPELYVYFAEKFKDEQGDLETKVETAEKDQSDGKDAQKNAESGAKDKGRFHGTPGTDIQGFYSNDEDVGILSSFIGSVGQLLDIARGAENANLGDVRDNLYVTTYIMSMFSYATYETEGLYDRMKQDKNADVTKLKLPSSEDYYPQEYKDYVGSVDAEYSWLSTKETDFYNKSLTLNMINSTNNRAYGAEVEYLLHGKTNEENVKAVYSDIFGIRYALNLVSAYQNFWSGNSNTAIAITSIANAISGATSGIIPVPVTKIVLLAILTAFETANDLDRLEAGFPVELYKKDQDSWWIKVEGRLQSIGSFLSDCSGKNMENPDKGLFYSDYLTLFVYLGLESTQNEQMYYRMADLIQSNMRLLLDPENGGDKSDYELKKAQLYFQLKAKLEVKPLMVTLPFFDEYDSELETETGWCGYTVTTVRGYS